jgi:hypothetical protein
MKNDKEMIQLVLARINTMPEHIKLHMGTGKETLDKEELLAHVKKQDPIGKKFVELQMQYIKATIRGFS